MLTRAFNGRITLFKCHLAMWKLTVSGVTYTRVTQEISCGFFFYYFFSRKKISIAS